MWEQMATIRLVSQPPISIHLQFHPKYLLRSSSRSDVSIWTSHLRHTQTVRSFGLLPVQDFCRPYPVSHLPRNQFVRVTSSYPHLPTAPLEILNIVPSLTAEPLNVASTSNTIAAHNNPEDTALQEFTNSDLTPELARQRAAPLLNSKNLLWGVQELSQEGQMKFIDKVDQVGLGDPPFSP